MYLQWIHVVVFHFYSLELLINYQNIWYAAAEYRCWVAYSMFAFCLWNTNESSIANQQTDLKLFLFYFAICFVFNISFHSICVNLTSAWQQCNEFDALLSFEIKMLPKFDNFFFSYITSIISNCSALHQNMVIYKRTRTLNGSWLCCLKAEIHSL